MNSVALDPAAFEAHVAQAETPRSAHLTRFITRHAPGVSVVIGELDGYDWRTGVLSLTPETNRGEGMRSLLIVAHECAHALQHREMPGLPWWAFKFPIVRLWFECDAWRRSLSMLS